MEENQRWIEEKASQNDIFNKMNDSEDEKSDWGKLDMLNLYVKELREPWYRKVSQTAKN